MIEGNFDPVVLCQELQDFKLRRLERQLDDLREETLRREIKELDEKSLVRERVYIARERINQLYKLEAYRKSLDLAEKDGPTKRFVRSISSGDYGCVIE